MPILTLEDSNYSGPIPEDEILPARITGVAQKKKPFQDDNGNDIIRIEFAFIIETAEIPDKVQWDGTRLWGDTSTTFTTHPECRLRAWAQEVYATELPAGFKLDTDDLIGKHVRVVVGLRTYQKDGEEKTRNFVKDLLRAKSGSPYAAIDEPPF